MSRTWKIVSHSDQKIELESGAERKVINRPTDKANLLIFLSLRPDEFVSDTTVESFLLDKENHSSRL
jgi:hypothetical protein